MANDQNNNDLGNQPAQNTQGDPNKPSDAANNSPAAEPATQPETAPAPSKTDDTQAPKPAEQAHVETGDAMPAEGNAQSASPEPEMVDFAVTGAVSGNVKVAKGTTYGEAIKMATGHNAPSSLNLKTTDGKSVKMSDVVTGTTILGGAASAGQASNNNSQTVTATPKARMG